MKAKFKKFIESIGFTKAQLITVFLCYFLCFALFLGIVVIWDPKSKVVDATVPTAPTINADENWTDHRATGFRSGSGTSSDPYLIASADELAYLAYSVNNGTSYSGKYFRQIDDIDLAAYAWVAIGDSTSNPFSGNYDGGNYLIEGMFSDGLFEYITYSTGRQVIENIILKNCVSYWGICHNAYGAPSDTAETLYFRNCVVDITMNFNSLTTINVGAITCGSSGAVWFQYCVNYSDITISTSGSVAGIVGEASGPSNFINCVNLGNILNSSNGSVGGIFGSCNDSSMNMIIGCVNRGSIEGHRYTGGIGGYLYGHSIVFSNTNAGPVSGGSDVGGIVGSAFASSVANCSNFGEISAYDSYVGGLFGRLWFSGFGEGTHLAQSFNRGNIVASGADWVGGLVGEAIGDDGGSFITDCYNVGEVEGSGRYYGGIVGELLSSSGNFTITRTFNNENITGGTDVGGLVGNVYIYNSGSASISACFSGNCATSGNSNVGPIFGRASGSPLSVTHVYYFEDLSSAYGTRETREFADTISSSSWYSSISWDMTNWSFDEDGGNALLPRLVLLLSDVIYDTSWYTASGGASSSSPYLISDFGDVLGMMYLNVEEGLDFSGKYFRQTADIDFRLIDENTMSSTGGMGDLAAILVASYQFVGIGQRRLSLSATNTVASTGEVFAGNYDGNGYSISGVISYGNYYEQGIFGYVSGTVQNLVVKESYIFGRSYVGGIAGYSSGTISSCANQAYVAGSSYVGGIAGCASGTVTNCYNTGQVVGGSYVGGIAGYLGDNGSNINRCYNNGFVTGSSDVAGIVGRMNSYNLTSDAHVYIYNCINLGRVNGAGIVGRMRLGYAAWGVDNYAYVYNCYNLGYATGNAIVGTQEKGTGSSSRYHFTVSGCYFGANYGRTTTSYGGSYNSSLTMDTPRSSSWFTNSSNWNSSYPWDFTNTWTIDPSKNNSYPILRNAQAEQPIAYWTDFGNYSIEWYTSSDTVTYGDGSASNPYKISTAEDLAGLSYLVYSEQGPHEEKYYFSGVYFQLTANLDMSNYYWQPIGTENDRLNYLAERFFAGNFDGGNHTISNIITPDGNITAYSCQGLFGWVEANGYDVAIKNVNIANSTIYGNWHVGAVVGRAVANNGGNLTIENCHSSSTTVIGRGANVGGIVGYLLNCSDDLSINIENCTTSGSSSVSGTSNYTGGLIGRANGGGVVNISGSRNISSVSGVSFVGGLVGACMIDTELTAVLNIDDSYNSSSVSGTTEYTGGLVGYSNAQTTTITKSYNTGSISGMHYVGGLAGEIHNETSGSAIVKNCYNTGTVNATGNNVGGIVGRVYLTESSFEISNCYNNAAISSPVTDANVTNTNIRIGGIIGESYSSGSGSNVSVKNSFSTGAITGRSMIGGVTGVNIGSGTHNISNTYYSGNNGTLGSDGSYLSDLTTLAGTESFFSPFSRNWQTGEDVAWDFFTVWKIDANLNNGYPTFREESEIVEFWTDHVTVTSYGGGNGTQSSPYKIQSAQQLALLAKNVNSGNSYSGKYFIQTADINLSGYLWDPIGRDYDRYGAESLNRFAGNYDGAGFKVTGISTSNLLSYQGFFGSATGSITRVNISDSNINGYYCVGGVVGMAPGVISITECKNSATIFGAANDSYVGGVVGYADAYSSSSIITITNCYNTGSIGGSSYVGGVVGDAYNTTIVSCYNTGSVDSSGDYVGGIVGYASLKTTITNCYNTGNVTSTATSYSYVGGVAGEATGSATIESCYNTGNVTSTATSFSYVGGVVGEATGSATIESCYNAGSVNGSSSVGGVAGAVSTATIESCYNTGAVTGSSSYVGGVVGYAYASSTTGCNISKSANFGDITVTGSSGSVGGIVGYVRVTSSSYGFKMANCYSEGSITVSGTNVTVGGFVGKLYADYSTYSNVKIEFCSVDLDIVVSGGSIASQGAFYGGTNGLTVDNSYSLLTKSGTVSKVISDVSTQMDNNFGYMLNFKEGKPIPLGIFHILDVATRTGIVNRINAL